MSVCLAVKMQPSKELHKTKNTVILDGVFCWLGALAAPAEGLAQYPKRRRNGNKEQAQTNRTAPAEPRAPRAPMLEMVIVAPAGFLLDVLDTFALVLHKVPFVN